MLALASTACKLTPGCNQTNCLQHKEEIPSAFFLVSKFQAVSFGTLSDSAPWWVNISYRKAAWFGAMFENGVSACWGKL